MKLRKQIHLERTANTAVLKSHKRIIALTYYSALFNQRGIDIYFAYIIDYHGKSNAFLIRKNTVEERRFAAPQITGY